jgi:hypothetical protein
MPFYAVGQTGVPFGIIDVVQIPVNAAELNGLSGSYFRNGANLTGVVNATQLDSQAGSYYRNATNLTGTAQLSGSFTGSFSGNLTGTASNADFLDGLDSTYFRNGANLTGTINAAQLNSQVGSYYLNLANITGTLPVSKGGSGATTLSGILKGNGTGAFSMATVGTDYVAPSSPTVFTATQTFSGSSSSVSMVLNDAAEVVTVTGIAAGTTINYDVTTQSVLYYTTNATGNWTTNFRASSGTSLNTMLASGQSVTAAFLATQGATAYYNNVVQVDGATAGVSTRWQGGTAPSAGNASSVDSYVYTIIKTGNAGFAVFASQTRFA